VRVALVSGQPDPRRCGVADYTRRLADALRAEGADVSVVTGRRWDVREVAGVARRLQASAPDIVHVQWAAPAYGRDGRAAGLLPALLGAGRRRPGRPRLAVTVHEYGEWGWSPPLGARAGWHPEGGFLLPRADAVVATNELHAGRLAAAGVDATVVPIGANLDAPAPAGDREDVRTALGVLPGAHLVAFFGFVAPVKGIAELLDAMALLRAVEGRDVHLALAGGLDGLALGTAPGAATAWRRELRDRIAAAGLEGAVHVLGWRPQAEVSRLLHAADAAALPFRGGVSRKSGSLLALLDHGVPTVVTPWSPPDPRLADGAAVRVVPERDPDALAAALAGLLDDPAGATALAARGRALVAEHGWPAIARRHLELYAAAGVPGAQPVSVS
jgi:glycosyltransferase involved in cell wall biosynthesis